MRKYTRQIQQGKQKAENKNRLLLEAQHNTGPLVNVPFPTAHQRYSSTSAKFTVTLKEASSCTTKICFTGAGRAAY